MIILAGVFLCLILLIATAASNAVDQQLDAMDAEKAENDGNDVELA